MTTAWRLQSCQIEQKTNPPSGQKQRKRKFRWEESCHTAVDPKISASGMWYFVVCCKFSNISEELTASVLQGISSSERLINIYLIMYCHMSHEGNVIETSQIAGVLWMGKVRWTWRQYLTRYCSHKYYQTCCMIVTESMNEIYQVDCLSCSLKIKIMAHTNHKLIRCWIWTGIMNHN